MAALSAAGVRPVGFGTVRTRGSSRTSSAAISSVRSADGPSAITTSISPSYSCARMWRTASRRYRSSLRTGMITETGAGAWFLGVRGPGAPRKTARAPDTLPRTGDTGARRPAAAGVR